MRRFLYMLTVIGIFLSLGVSCGVMPSARYLAETFREQYGIDAVIFSPGIPEGERGYVREGLFETLYGDHIGSVSDFALILHSDGESVYECAVMLAVSEYDAVILCDVLFERMELIRSVASDDTSLDGAFVKRKGRLVVMCAMPDNRRAELIWEKIM